MSREASLIWGHSIFPVSSPVLPPLTTLLQLEGTGQFKSQTPSPTGPGGFSAQNTPHPRFTL